MKIVFLTFAFIIILVITSGTRANETYLVGVYNNFDFSRPAQYWSDATKRFGGENGVIDLVVAQANINGLVYLPFSINSNGLLANYSKVDTVEPYLDEFDAEGLNVILSIQPLKANITQILEILLSRYSHHESIIGFNIDLEWKESETPNHVNNEERDLYLKKLRDYNTDFKLFLTYFKNYTHFPQDSEGLVILYDGQSDTQKNLLNHYKELAEHYNTVGIYTGYSSSIPPTASHESIMANVSKTTYIIHTDDVTIPNWPLYLVVGLLIVVITGLSMILIKKRTHFFSNLYKN